MVLVMITGAIGSGKTTAANLLTKHGFITESFAAPLKQIAVIFGFNHNDVYGTQDQKLKINPIMGISGRTFMQKFGTEICQDALPLILPNMRNVWINCMKMRLNKLDCGQHVVIGDGRFLSEAEFVHNNNGIIIQITRAGKPYQHHKSEQPITHDYSIKNNGTINDLHKQLMSIIEPLLNT